MLGRVLLLLFIVSYFCRLTSRFPILGIFRFELLLGCAILFCIFLTNYSDKWRRSVQSCKQLYIFLFYVVISLPLVTWPGSVLRFHLEEWLKAAFFFLFIVTLVRTTQQLKLLIYVFMGTQAFRILEPLYLHLKYGYWGSQAFSSVGGTQTFLNRLSGAPHDVVNPNQLAWVIVNIVPFVFYLLWQGGKSGKILAMMSAPPFIYCLLLTGSRSGLLSFIFVLLVMVYLSRNPGRNFFKAMILAAPLAVFAFGMLAGNLQTRYHSLINQGVAGGDTVRGRIDSLTRGIGSISNNPLFGNGLGTSGETNTNVLGGKAQITHNLYLEVFQEVGLIGFTLFMMYIFAILKCLCEARRLLLHQGRGEMDWLYRFVTAVQAWVVMDLFYSLSCFGLRSWEWYFFGAVATVSLALAKEQNCPTALGITKQKNLDGQC